ncbi:MAG: CopG family ribbon-helix-helix protein [Candidatus Altiarchaeota archaeon]
MTVISVSLPEETIREIDRMVGSGGYKGRSDAVKSSVHYLSKELNLLEKSEGRVSGILVLIHDEKHENAFSKARHEFEGLIKTLIHNQVGGGKCLELFILEGESAKVGELIRACRRSGRAEYLKLITA